MKNFMTNNFWLVFGSIFGLIGGIFLAVGLFVYFDHQSFMETATITEGEVVDLVAVRSEDSTTYKPLVSFVSQTGEAIEFSTNFSSNPPRYDVGEVVSVAYQAGEAEAARLASGPGFLAYGFAGMGALFVAIGVVSFVVNMRKRAWRRRLLQSGRRIQATVTGVGLNTSITINGQHPYAIKAQYHDPSTNTMYTYQSGSVWFDPSAHIGESIEVLVDQSDFGVYHIDLSFLPESA